MKRTTEEFEIILKELMEIMKSETIAKVYSHVMSLQQQNEDLKKSRDKLKKDNEEMKKEVNKLERKLKEKNNGNDK